MTCDTLKDDDALDEVNMTCTITDEEKHRTEAPHKSDLLIVHVHM